MDCTCGISISIKRTSNSHVRNVMWALGGALASTIVIFGALGSIQNQCRNEDPALLAGINGFSMGLSCKKLYRYYWFITALDLVASVYGLWTAATGALSANRGAVVGLVVIANLLTINMTDAFYNILDIVKFQEGTGRDRAHAMVAGCIMTAVFQAIALFLAGMDASAASESPASVEEAPKAKAVELPVAAPKAAEPDAAAPTPEPAPAVITEAPAEAEAVAAAEPAEAEPKTESAVAVTVQ
ncbi:hypothetical protein GPECTOR_22g909 [Gonium pectorale]|uniref:CASP-like protein n=1 Tax=Gonium pectorale TaxID=33097 RepID=A0A150GI48_GONPE|nr:hypothetical protein GPECTOR_22g909 [Gonium pectorale]|eukprot:KXZ49315.1 hypothetical protein GPECTOR_22g909 [Gonium pectorale]